MTSEKSGNESVEDGQESNGTGGVSYALIHEATSLKDFGKLEDPESIASQLARGRGKGTVEDRLVKDQDGNESAEYHVTVEEGRLKVDSGYVVRFVNESQLDLNAFDVMSLDTVKAYPAPERMIESLTPRIRGHLKEHGFVQIRGAYSPTDSRFYGVQLGWNRDNEVDPWDRLMEVIGQVSTTPAALDYVFVEEGPDRWGVDEVSQVRGIEPASVRGNVRAIENEFDE